MESMPSHVREVAAGKSLALFRKLLEETEFPDMSVCDYMEKGVCLTGWELDSPLYQKRRKPPSLTKEQLNHQAMWRGKAMMSKANQSIPEDHDPLHEETLKEAQAGFLRGPYTSDQIADILGTGDWSLSRRFALSQNDGKKVRIIDDFKESAVNSAFGSSSHLALQDTDFFSGFLRFVSRVCMNREAVVVQLPDGAWLTGPWRPFCRGVKLMGRCMDLSKAYKQFAFLTDSLIHGVLGYEKPGSGLCLYTTQSPPFGASASVFATFFNLVGWRHATAETRPLPSPSKWLPWEFSIPWIKSLKESSWCRTSRGVLTRSEPCCQMWKRKSLSPRPRRRCWADSSTLLAAVSWGIL